MTTDRPRCVKELGPELGRSCWFVYKMRQAGFQMRDGVATPTQAVRWIKRTGFKVVRGSIVLTRLSGAKRVQSVTVDQ